MACLNIENKGEFKFKCSDIKADSSSYWMNLIKMNPHIISESATIDPDWAEYYKSEVDMWQAGYTPKQF